MVRLITGLVFVFLLSGFCFVLTSPVRISWTGVLSDVKFHEKYHKGYEMFFLYPEFGEKLKATEGKTVYIKGYIIPIDIEGDLHVLSANPMSTCFFCGGAGPETVIELELKKGHRKYRVDELLYFKGVLKLNATDVDHLNYIFKEAQQYSP